MSQHTGADAQALPDAQVRSTVATLDPLAPPVRVRREPQIEVVEPGEVDYPTAWEWQRSLADARADGRGVDTVLLLTHPAVYTAGSRTQPADRPTDGTPVVDVDRGGRITWHGPGQLVGYPVVALADPVKVVGYVRLLEQALIAACADLGLSGAGRIAGRSGVWLPADSQPERKIAAIGVRIAKKVTTHGFALNCNPDLAAYDRIVPCGIRDAGVTSLSAELGTRVDVEHALPAVRARLLQALAGELTADGSVLDRSVPGSVAVPAGITWELDASLAGPAESHRTTRTPTSADV